MVFGCSKTGSIFSEKVLARDKNLEATILIAKIICGPFQDGRKSEQQAFQKSHQGRMNMVMDVDVLSCWVTIPRKWEQMNSY